MASSQSDAACSPWPTRYAVTNDWKLALPGAQPTSPSYWASVSSSTVVGTSSITSGLTTITLERPVTPTQSVPSAGR